MKKRIKPVEAARKRRPLAAPDYQPALGLLLGLAGDAYARVALKLKGLDFVHAERLVEAFRDFQEGRARLILAFRHPYGDEAQLFTLAFDRALPRLARELGRPLPARSHANFVHGYEVPLWSGPLVRWLLPRMGALPVYHAKYAGASLRKIRQALLDGKHPLALAPEGQVSYRSETVPRLEQGTARLAFWCAEELAAAGRPERVLVLPLSVHNRYEETDLTELEAFVGGLESDCGIPRDPASPGVAPRVKTTACCGDPGSLAYKPPPPADGGASRRATLAARLRRLDERLLRLAEGYYGLSPATASSREERRAALLEEALRRGEAMLGLPSDPARAPLSAEAAENRINRVYRIRQAGWDRIYPEGGVRQGSPLERRLENRLAGEAWYAMRHMELVDLLHYLDEAYLDEKPSLGRLVETASSLGDLATRFVGGDISHRPNPLAKAATIVVAPPIDLGARLGEYAADKRAAAARATADLESAYLSCIKENPHA